MRAGTLGKARLIIAKASSLVIITSVIIAQQMRAARALIGMTRKELAQKARISVATINNIEREANTNPQLATLKSSRSVLEAESITFESEKDDISVKLKAAKGMMYRVVSFLCLVFSSNPSQAEDFIEWQTANIQFLKGWDYEVGPEKRALITFEYANRWRYGDFFMFVDGTRFDDGGTAAYTEISPRFSLSRMTGADLSYGIIKDVLISTTYEKGKKNIQAYLYGGAVDFKLPGFTFFKTNFYLRDSRQHDDNTWQITVAWNRPFDVGNIKLLAEGFADFAGNAGVTYHANQFIVPRLLIDIGDLTGRQPSKLWAGLEYSYWHNKFGIDGKTESAPQLQIKWVF